MEVFNKLAIYIQNIEAKQLQKYLLVSLVGMTCLVGGIIYYVQNKKSDLITDIQQLHNLANKAVKIIDDNRKMVKEEQRLRDILEREPGFTIRGYFEQFCKDQELVPERGWDAHTESVNEKFDEIVLSATFKGQSTEKLVKILTALDQKEIVYIKELVVRNENNGKISFDITIATKQDKAIIE